MQVVDQDQNQDPDEDGNYPEWINPDAKLAPKNKAIPRPMLKHILKPSTSSQDDSPLQILEPEKARFKNWIWNFMLLMISLYLTNLAWVLV